MTDKKPDDPTQTEGREKNGAIPAGRPDASTSDEDVQRNAQKERRSAGPDGPDAREVGDLFKRPER